MYLYTCVCVCVYVCIYMCIYVYLYIGAGQRGLHGGLPKRSIREL